MSSAVTQSRGGGARKSAVELLAESKAFYVKSENLLQDRTQQLRRQQQQQQARAGQYILVSPSHSLPPQTRQLSNRRAISSAGADILQTKLRKLLNCADSKENVGYPGHPDGAKFKLSANIAVDDGCQYKSLSQIGQHYQRSEYSTYNQQQESSTRYIKDLNLSQNDFFPNSFLSPQSTQNTFSSTHETSQLLYHIDNFETSGKSCDNLNLTDDYRAISPPAEYAVTERSSYRCVRSYSHSQPIQQNSPNDHCYNINSHKSLPDLYSQSNLIHLNYDGNSTEALSSCSKGTKSNRSSDVFSKSNKSSDIFIKSSRSNSSFNRDSGGSSGHYTHRSEPIRKNIEYRRDSGSSTQHSGNSAYYEMYNRPVQRFPNIIETQIVENCVECQALYQERHCECDDVYKDDSLMHFETPAVPEQFQDGYEDKIKSPQFYKYDEYTHNSYTSQQYTQANIYMDTAKYKITDCGYTKDCNYRVRDSGSCSLPVDPELSPPLGTFKRQKCFRYKNRPGRYSSHDCVDDRKPVLRSKSDISDRYYRGEKIRTKTQKSLQRNVDNETLSHLERFFDQLGLNDETYDELLVDNERLIKNKSLSDSGLCDSPVFFSDVSTIDSNRPFECTDFTNTGPPVTATPQTGVFRSNEPPSIVERNARIIKWLCNCRKMQMTAEK